MRTSRLFGLIALTILMGTFTTRSSSAASLQSIVRMLNRANPFAYANYDKCKAKQWRVCKKRVGISDQALKCRERFHKKRPCKLLRKHKKNEIALRGRLKRLRKQFKTAKGKKKKQIRKALIRWTKDLAWTVGQKKKFGPKCEAYTACYNKNKEKTEQFLRCFSSAVGSSCANPAR